MSTTGSRVTGDCKHKPVLTITYYAWCKIWKLTRANKGYECTSMGIMDPDDPCRLIDIYVPKQVNTPSSTKADQDDILRWVADCVSKGIDPSQLNCWMHSHSSMSVFWSSTDVDTINRLEGEPLQWSIVTNEKEEYKVRADIFAPFRYWWDDCEVEIEYPQITGLDQWFDELSKDKIENSKYTYSGMVRKGTAGKKSKKASSKHGSTGRDHFGSGETFYNKEEYFAYYELAEKYGHAMMQSELPAVVEVEENKEVLHLSHPLIQCAYDNDILTMDEAQILEMEYLNAGSMDDSDLIDSLRSYAALGGKYTFAEGTDTENNAAVTELEEKLEQIIEIYEAMPEQLALATQDLDNSSILIEEKEQATKEEATTE